MRAQGSCMHMTSRFKETMSCNISEGAISTHAEVRGHVFFLLSHLSASAPGLVSSPQSLRDADMRFHFNYLRHKWWGNLNGCVVTISVLSVLLSCSFKETGPLTLKNWL